MIPNDNTSSIEFDLKVTNPLPQMTLAKEKVKQRFEKDLVNFEERMAYRRSVLKENCKEYLQRNPLDNLSKMNVKVKPVWKLKGVLTQLYNKTFLIKMGDFTKNRFKNKKSFAKNKNGNTINLEHPVMPEISDPLVIKMLNLPARAITYC